MNQSERIAVAEAKHTLRAKARTIREEAAIATPDAAENLCAQVLAEIPIEPDAVISAYWPKGPEIDARPLMTVLHGRGHIVGLPVVVTKGEALLFRRWQPDDTLERGGFGVEIPSADKTVVQPNFLVVPLLAFDRLGYRLGYGGGFYDRTLASLRATSRVTAVGVAYSGQEVAAVPRDSTDQVLDWVVTEGEAIKIG